MQGELKSAGNRAKNARVLVRFLKCGKQSKECESSSSVLSTVSYLRAKNARVLVRFLISAGNRARNARVLAWF